MLIKNLKECGCGGGRFKRKIQNYKSLKRFWSKWRSLGGRVSQTTEWVKSRVALTELLDIRGQKRLQKLRLFYVKESQNWWKRSPGGIPFNNIQEAACSVFLKKTQVSRMFMLIGKGANV